MQDMKYEDLTPSSDETVDENGFYCDSMEWALNNDQIKNIALTGVYGSGKSSIIQKFVNRVEGTNKASKKARHSFFNISLAYFEEHHLDTEDIEQGILQQLFYQEDPKITPFSRFRRINALSIPRFLIYELIFLVFIWSLTYTVLPSFYSSLSVTTIISIILGLIIFSFLVWKTICNTQLGKINIGTSTANIEISPEKTGGVFNKYLDEIVYFFEVTKYDVIIFEDLDRFKDRQIFVKLSELNNILNNNNRIKKSRKITFLFALRDDIFSDTERTKLFDFILPIIPAINSSNSYEQLKKRIRVINNEKIRNSDNLDDITDEFLNDISVFIDDMRILKNITNEYITYLNKLQNVGLSLKMILSIVVYKNLCPNDFADLQKGKGIVYDQFEKKKDAIKEREKTLKCQIIDLEKRIGNTENELMKDIKELKIALLSNFNVFNSYNGYHVKLGNSNISFIDFYSNDYKISEILEVVAGNRFTLKDLDFKRQIEEFSAREIAIYDKNQKEDLEKELNKIRSELKNVKTLTLSELIDNSLVNMGDDKSIIPFLLKRGYIDETYPNYLSYFHVGDLLPTDMQYILSVRRGIRKDYSYIISNPYKVLQKMILRDFLDHSWFNYEVFFELIKSPKGYEEYYKQSIASVCDESQEAKDFLYSYWTTDMCQSDLDNYVSSIAKAWPGFWNWVINDSQFNEANRKQIFALLQEYVELEFLDKFQPPHEYRNYALQCRDYLEIVSKVNVEKAKCVIRHFNMLFTNLNVVTSNILVDYIFKNCYFEINIEMINKALMIYGDVKHEDTITKNYTSILNGNLEWLNKYILQNINDYVLFVFLKIEQNREETEKTVIVLLGNADLDTENKNAIIVKENVKIARIKTISSELWDCLIENNKLVPTLDNVAHYYKEKGYKPLLTQFIHTNSNAISKTTFTSAILNEQKTALLQDIICDMHLSVEAFRNMLDIGIKCNISQEANNYTNLSTEKLTELIKTGIIGLNSNNFEILKSLDNNSQIVLVDLNQEEYEKVYHDIQLDAATFIKVMNSKIKDEIKREIIGMFFEQLITQDYKVIQVTADYIVNQWPEEAIPNIIIEKLLNLLKEDIIKSRLLTIQSVFIDENRLEGLLDICGDPFSKMHELYQRPRLPFNKYTKLFAEMMQNRGFIGKVNANRDELILHPKKRV